jgi:hypothetical protein
MEREILDREETKARLAGKIAADGTRWGSADGNRAMVKAPARSRRRCHCGCGSQATHTGLGDGLALTMGCELYIRRWVRDGYGDLP